jgi:hypothetical protein
MTRAEAIRAAAARVQEMDPMERAELAARKQREMDAGE